MLDNSLNEILNFSEVRCDSIKNGREYCECLKPYVSNVSDKEKEELKKESYLYIGEDFLKTFEVSLTEILLDTSFLQFQINDSPYFDKVINKVTSECSIENLKRKIKNRCSEKSLYSLTKEMNLDFSVEKITAKLQSKIDSRESSKDKKCSISELDGEVMRFDSLVQNLNYMFMSMEDELAESNSVKEAIKLKMKKARSQKDIEGFKSYKALLKTIGQNQKISNLLNVSSSSILSSIKREGNLKIFLGSEEMSNNYGSRIAKGCRETYEAYVKSVCQDISEPIYNYSKDQLGHDGGKGKGHRASVKLSCLNGNYKKTSLKSTKDDRDLILKYSIEKHVGSNVEDLNSVLKKNYNDNTKKVKDALCKNLPDSSLETKKQIKEIDSKISEICNDNLLSEECVYLKKYKSKLSFNIEKEKEVKNNKSFAKFKKENPFSKIKTEKDYIEKMGKRSVAKMAFFGEVKELEEKKPKNSEQLVEKVKEVKVSDTSKPVIVKRSFAKETTTSKLTQSDFVPVPKGLSFSYSKKRDSRYKNELKKIEKQIAKEEKRKKDLLEQYKKSSVQEQQLIDKQLDEIDDSFRSPSVATNYSNVDDFIKEQYRIDSGVQKLAPSRKIASKLNDSFLNPKKDPYRDTINREVLSNDRIDVVDNIVNSGEKINAFNLKLGANGYEIQKLIFSGAIEKDLSLVYDKNPKKSIVDKIARSSYEQSEQVKKYKKLLKSKKDFLISKNSELDIEVIVQYSNSKQRHIVKPFIGSLNDSFYLQNKRKYEKLKAEVETSIREGDFETLSKIAS